MIPVMFAVGLVVGRGPVILVAAAMWPIILVAEGGTYSFGDLAVAATLAALNASVGIIFHAAIKTTLNAARSSRA